MSLTTQANVNVLNGKLACAFNNGRPSGDNELPNIANNALALPMFQEEESPPYGGDFPGDALFGSNWTTFGNLYNAGDNGEVALGFTFQQNHPPFKTLGLQLSSQKKVLKLFGLGTNFPSNSTFTNTDQNRDYNPNAGLSRWNLCGMSNQVPVPAFPTVNAWCRNEWTTNVAIPNNAVTAKFGAYIRVPENDNLRQYNCAGLYVYQDKELQVYNAPNIYVTPIVVRNSNHTLVNMFEGRPSITSGDVKNRQQWSGINTRWTGGPGTAVGRYNDKCFVNEVKYYTTDEFRQFRKVEHEVTLETGGYRRLGISCFFGENQSYLNASGTPSGAAFFYNPFIQFFDSNGDII
jgi:hypothetical protein